MGEEDADEEGGRQRLRQGRKMTTAMGEEDGGGDGGIFVLNLFKVAKYPKDNLLALFG
uniref:Uncharacterized protein n=1 Tax=Oryza sativa subsp. japonica TaxID=39947 RepID=Q6K636_ORYSJ|nr:hypothetical protein [Oryza sativa Japonica Group]